MLLKTLCDSPSLVPKNVVYACRFVSNQSARPVTYEETKAKVKMAQRFGQLGLKSGVDIRKLWPAVEEIQEIQTMRLHRTAREATEIAKEAQRNKEEKYAQRLHEVEEKMKEYP